MLDFQALIGYFAKYAEMLAAISTV